MGITKDRINDAQKQAPQNNMLPDLCYAVPLTSGQLVIIKNGELGYYSCSYSTPDVERNKEIAAHCNERLGVTAAQVKAMEFGCLFGWDKPGANPALYEKKALQKKIAEAEAKANAQTQEILQKTPLAQQR